MICTIPVMPKQEFSFNYIEGTAEGFNVRYDMTNCRQIDGVKRIWNHCVFRDDRWDVTISTFL